MGLAGLAECRRQEGRNQGLNCPPKLPASCFPPAHWLLVSKAHIQLAVQAKWALKVGKAAGLARGNSAGAEAINAQEAV